MDRPNARSLPRHSPGSRPPSIDSAYLSSPLLLAQLGTDSYFTMRAHSHSAPHIGGNPHLPGPPPSDDVSESSGSESLSGLFWKRGGKPGESPLQSFATDLTNDLRSHSGLGTPPTDQKFVGTPDYLAPESILGISGDDPTVDWVGEPTNRCCMLTLSSGPLASSPTNFCTVSRRSMPIRPTKCLPTSFPGKLNGTRTGLTFQTRPATSWPS